MNPNVRDLAQASRTGKRTKEELLQTISASRLGTWLSCRLKFYLRYMAGPIRPPSAAMHVGSVVHAVLQQWNLARWRKSPLEQPMVKTVFDQLWSKRQANQEEIRWNGAEEVFKSAAFALVETYLRDTPIPIDERPEGVEVSVEKDLSRQGLPTLVGVLDLVRQKGKIVDFKTTGRSPNSNMVVHTTEIQTTAYAVLYRDATGRQEGGIELHHLVRLKIPKLVVTAVPPATNGQINRLLRLIDSYVRGLEQEDIFPSPGLQCSSCEFVHECRRWH